MTLGAALALAYGLGMIFRQLLNDETACASYLFGCNTAGGSICGRGLSGNPASTIGFERRHNRALGLASEDAFVAALVEDLPPEPERQAEIVAANRSGRPLAGVG